MSARTFLGAMLATAVAVVAPVGAFAPSAAILPDGALQEHTRDPSAVAWDQMRSHIAAGDIEAALQIAQEHRAEERFSPVYDALYRARQYHRHSDRGAGDQHYHSALAVAARSVGLYELAVLSHERAIDLITAKRPDDTSARAKHAFHAAMICAELGSLDEALRFLSLTEQYGQTWFREEAARLAEEMRRFAANPDDVEHRLRFAREFWISSTPALGGRERQAVDLLVSTLEPPYEPTTQQRKELYTSIVQLARKAKIHDVADRYTGLLATEFSGTDEAAGAILGHAATLAQDARFTEARESAERVLDGEYAKAWQLRARLTLARCALELGDEEAMVEHLLAVADDADTVPLNRHIMDTYDARQVALLWLGDHFRSKGNFVSALEYYRRYEPRSWCGTCSAQQAADRERRIAECVAALKEQRTTR